MYIYIYIYVWNTLYIYIYNSILYIYAHLLYIYIYIYVYIEIDEIVYIYIYVCTYIQYPHLLYVVSTWSNMACWRLHLEKSMSFPASRLHPEVFQHGDEALNVAAINTPSQTVPRCCDVLCTADMRQ